MVRKKAEPVATDDNLTPVQWALKRIDHEVEIITAAANSPKGDHEMVPTAIALANRLRQEVIEGADIDQIVGTALGLGAMTQIVVRGDRYRDWKARKDGRSEGGKKRRIVDPAHVAQLEAEANRLRILNPKWKPARICKAVAKWYGDKQDEASGDKQETKPPSEKTIKRALAAFFAAKNGQC